MSGDSSSRRPLLIAGLAVLVLVTVVTVLAIRKQQPEPQAATRGSALPGGPVLEDNQTALAQYAGSATCQGCHADEFAKWATSNHGMAERDYRPAMDEIAFAPPRTIEHGTQTSQAQIENGIAEFITNGFKNARETYQVVRVIGHDPLRQFLVSGPNDHLQTMELCWDPHRKEWFDVYGNEDRQPGEWGHWTGRGMNWNSMCANCHNTRLRKNYDPATDRYDTTRAEMSVGCEACHGPMKKHGEWQTAHPGAGGDPHLSGFTREQHFQTCGPCHARRGELTGDLVPGASFHDHFELTIPDDTEIYYADGQVREEDYEFASFLGSRMHAAGVRCVDCHDPHSGKRILADNSLCMRCHASPVAIPPLTVAAPVIDPTAHSHHRAGSTGNDCIGCHMPITTYMQRHPRHDHGFTSPDPLLTKKFGIPNACNRCHQDKDADWALTHSEEWYGEKLDRPARLRATIFAEARTGEFRARDQLITLLRSADEGPAWKASATHLLGRWVFDTPARAALIRQLKHEDPLVRSAAARALGPAAQSGVNEASVALQPMLTDPSRNVRISAAWSLRDTVRLDSVAGRELVHSLTLSADQPSGQMRLGQFVFARGKQDQAVAHMRRAIEWDPYSPPFHHDLAVMLNIAGNNEGALAALQEAIRLAPDNPEYHYKLALAMNEQGSLELAIESLRRTVELEPAHGRAWYNLGLAYNTLGQFDPAIDALRRGELADPADPGIPYARATIHARLNQRDEAIAAAQRALVIDPGFSQARELLRQLGQ